MRTSRTWLAAVVVVALLAGVVATPAAATGADGDGVASSDRAGPPADLPNPVPGVVERMLDSIRRVVSSVPTAGHVR